MYMTPNKARAIVERDEEKAIAAFGLSRKNSVNFIFLIHISVSAIDRIRIYLCFFRTCGFQSK